MIYKIGQEETADNYGNQLIDADNYFIVGMCKDDNEIFHIYTDQNCPPEMELIWETKQFKKPSQLKLF